MGMKLSEKDELKNSQEIYKFNLQCKNHNMFYSDIAVYKNDDIIFEGKNIATHVTERHAWWDIQIIWEDAGLGEEDFHKLGLFGVYSSGYCKMQSEYKSLIIFSDNNIKINIIAK